MWAWLGPTICKGCGVEGWGWLCPDCSPAGVRRVPHPHPTLRAVFTLRSYDSGLGRALRVTKYSRDRRLGQLLASTFAEAYSDMVVQGRFMAIVPAPSPWTRVLWRGFAPASLLAVALGRSTGVPVVHALRSRWGPPQAALDAQARARNLAGRIRAVREVPGRVLLVDDVYTTGATASACARELLGGQSAAVWVASLCAVREMSRN